MCNVSVNKNTIATDKSALNPSGIRLGTPAMTSRGLVEKDFKYVAKILNDICNLAIKIQQNSNTTKLVDFIKTSESYINDINNIKYNVEKYCCKFPLPL